MFSKKVSSLAILNKGDFLLSSIKHKCVFYFRKKLVIFPPFC